MILYVLCKFKTVYIFHINIQENQINFMILQEFNSIGAIIGFACDADIIKSAQGSLYSIKAYLFVIY